MPVTPENGIVAAAAAAVASHRADDPSEITKRSSNMHREIMMGRGNFGKVFK